MTSLEEFLERGLEEAKQLFEQDLPLLADYTLFLIRDKYKSAGISPPPEVEQLQEKFREKTKQIYPAKIKEEIAQGNLEEAMGKFLSLVLPYSREAPKTNPMPPHIPGEFYHLVTLIEEKAKGLNEDLRKKVDFFVSVYPKRRFKDI